MNLATFDFNETPVRVVDVQGEPWFVVADVCRVLDLSNPSMSAQSLDEDDLSSIEVIDSLGRKQTANAVNESGLYQLVFSSRKPEAKTFKRWVTKEVLPAIRKTGRYAMPMACKAPETEEDGLNAVIAVLKELMGAVARGEASTQRATTTAQVARQFLHARDITLRLRGVKEAK